MSRVLCIPAADYFAHADQRWGRRVGFLPFGAVEYDPEVLFRNAAWLDRDFAEQDPGHKQVIPYVQLLRGPAPVGILHYRRGKKGSEARLHGLRSLGIGGHVEPTDIAVTHSESRHATLCNAMRREVREEVLSLDGEPHVLRVAGLVNSEKDPVNRVHLGVVFDVLLDRRPHDFAPEIADPQWSTLAELKAMTCGWEEWSRLVLEGMG
ncbi:MAG: hypothetical protein AB7G11_16115 [Phycisphaerales bacterium]